MGWMDDPVVAPQSSEEGVQSPSWESSPVVGMGASTPVEGSSWESSPIVGEQSFTSTVAPESGAVSDFSKLSYSENDLTDDKFFQPIKDYMVDRFGVHLKDYDKEELVSMYVNNMRGFSSGNSVRAVNEITYLNEVGKDEERLAKAGKAYDLFENMQSLYTGDTTWGEAASGTLDYVRSAVLDPANVLGLGIAKTATGAGFKLGSQVALIAAKQAYKKEIAKGATAKAANEVAQGILKARAEELIADTAQKVATRQAVEKAATTFVQRVTTPTALKEAAATGGFEAAMAAGTDYLYQDALLRTKVQDEYNVYQTGLSAVVGLVAGGVSGALSNIGTGKSGLIAPTASKTEVKGSASVGKLLQTDPNAAIPEKGALSMGDWMKDVAKGKELADQDTQFFITMVLGDDEKGLKGLAHILLDDGYVWRRRNEDDTVSNWLGDIIKESDPQDAKKFLDDFSAATGIEMAEGKQLTIESFADTFKKKMSDSGKVLNSVSKLSKLLGKKPEDITIGDQIDFILGGGIKTPESIVSNAGKKIGKVVGDLINRDLPDFQNNIIRLMVSNLSTTALNVTGFAAASGLNSATDIVRAALYGGRAGIYMVYNPKEAKKWGMDALNILQNQRQKIKNTLDPNATYETFIQYAQERPEAMRQLTAVLPGGVESLDKIAKGFNPDTPLLTLRANQVVDIIGRANLVSAQDGYTKAIEFTSQLDKFLRRSKEDGGFGMSWQEFFSNPDHHKMMLSERFVVAEAKAVDETLKAVFSKSYKGKGLLGEVAGAIEDARNIPGIGLLIPFGRFFNNTMAMTFDMTAVGPLISKWMGGQETKLSSELVAKGAVTWGMIWMLSQREQEYMQKGLNWSEEIDTETGEVIDEKYEFPYGPVKAIARLLAHRQTGTEIPGELSLQLIDQFFGQLTRQFGEAGAGLGNIMKSLLSDEGPAISEVLGQAFGTIVSQAASGMTRPLEPINTVLGLTRDEEFYTPDRNQGTKWVNNSLRYIDQFVAIATGENIAPPKFTAAGGKPAVQASRLISTTRADRLTATDQVMNSIGLPNWKANMASLSDVADNRFNEVFHTLIESAASKLFDRKAFKEGDLETKQLLWANALKSARDATKTYMGRVAQNDGDRALLKILEISSFPKLRVQRTLDDLGFDRNVDELDEEELILLKKALDFREEFKLRD